MVQANTHLSNSPVQTDVPNARLISATPGDIPEGGQTFWINVDGGYHLRAAYWPVPVAHKPRGSVVLLSGYAEHIEKYLESIGDLLDQGFAVYTFDWRGQGLSTRVLSDQSLGFNRGYISSFDDHVGDALTILKHFDSLQAPGPTVLLAHSMGGNLALRVLEQAPERFQAAILSAPMLGLRGFPNWVLRVIANAYVRAGRGEHYAWGSKPMDLESPTNVVTGFAERFERNMNFLRIEPSLLTSGVTWGWVAAAAQSMRLIGKKAFIRRIKTPLLLLSTGEDLLVGQVGHEKLVKGVAAGQQHLLKQSFHEPLNESDEIRAEVWRVVGEFLQGQGI